MPIEKRSSNCDNLGAIKRLRIGLLADLSQQDFQTKPNQNVVFKAGLDYMFDMSYKDFELSDLEVSQENKNGIANNVNFSVVIKNDLLASNFDPTYRKLEGRLLVAEITTMNDNVSAFAPLLSSYKYNQGTITDSPSYTFSFEKVASIRYKDYIFPKINEKIILAVTSESVTANTFRALVEGVSAFVSPSYEAGFSLINDINTVTDWYQTISSGKLVISTVPNKTLIYVFVRQQDDASICDVMPHFVNIEQYSLTSKMISLEVAKPEASDLLEFDGSNTVS